MNDDINGHRRYFLVDYENVNRDGLVGVEHLSKRDDGNDRREKHCKAHAHNG